MPPKIALFSFGDTPSNFGDSATVTCSVNSGDPPFIIAWFLNGEPIKGDKNILITPVGKRSSALNIEYVEEEQAGNYTCDVRNSAGNVNHTSSLIVKGYYHSNCSQENRNMTFETSILVYNPISLPISPMPQIQIIISPKIDHFPSRDDPSNSSVQCWLTSRGFTMQFSRTE